MGNVDKTIFGYATQWNAAGKDAVLEVPALGFGVRAPTRGRAVRHAWDAALAALDAIEAAGGAPPPRPTEGSFHEGVAQRVRRLNRELVPHGYYALAEDLKRSQAEALERASAKTKELAAPLPKDVEDEIVSAFFDSICSANQRALNMVGLWMKANTLKEFAHVVDQAYMSLYTGEFIAPSMVLTPAVEGVLLRWYGFDPSLPNAKPRPEQLLDFIAEKTCSDAPQ